MSKLQQHLEEVNLHLPEGLKLTQPVGKKALRHARSCLAYTYQSESLSREGARILGPLNAILDQIEALLPDEPIISNDPGYSTSKNTTTNPPREQPKGPAPAQAAPKPSWRDPPPLSETPAERAFREALEALEKANARRAKEMLLWQSQRASDALDVVDRYLHGDQAGAAVATTPEARLIQELRRALLHTLRQRSGPD